MNLREAEEALGIRTAIFTLSNGIVDLEWGKDGRGPVMVSPELIENMVAESNRREVAHVQALVKQRRRACIEGLLTGAPLGALLLYLLTMLLEVAR